MPPKRHPSNLALLPGCLFPPEVIQRIASFYVGIYQEEIEDGGDQTTIMPLLLTCRGVQDMILPIFYEEVTLEQVSQLLKFLDPTKTPSSHFQLIHKVNIHCTWTSEEKDEIDTMSKKRHNSLLELPTGGRSLRNGGGRHGQPLLLPKLHCLKWRLGSLGEVVQALEPKLEIIEYAPDVEVRAPWIADFVPGDCIETVHQDRLQYGHLAPESMLIRVPECPGARFMRVLILESEKTTFKDNPVDDEFTGTYLYLEDWDGRGEMSMKVYLVDPEEEVERVAKQWEEETEGAELVIERTVEESQREE